MHPNLNINQEVMSSRTVRIFTNCTILIIFFVDITLSKYLQRTIKEVVLV